MISDFVRFVVKVDESGEDNSVDFFTVIINHRGRTMRISDAHIVAEVERHSGFDAVNSIFYSVGDIEHISLQEFAEMSTRAMAEDACYHDDRFLYVAMFEGKVETVIEVFGGMNVGHSHLVFENMVEEV